MDAIERRRVGVLRPNPVLASQKYAVKTRPYLQWCALPRQEAKNLKNLAKDDWVAYSEAIFNVLVKTAKFYKQHGVIIRDARKPGRNYIPGLAITPFEWRHMLSCPRGVFWQAGILMKNERDRTVMAPGDPLKKLDEWLAFADRDNILGVEG